MRNTSRKREENKYTEARGNPTTPKKIPKNTFSPIFPKACPNNYFFIKTPNATRKPCKKEYLSTKKLQTG
jgi:hypothetical protein